MDKTTYTDPGIGMTVTAYGIYDTSWINSGIFSDTQGIGNEYASSVEFVSGGVDPLTNEVEAGSVMQALDANGEPSKFRWFGDNGEIFIFNTPDAWNTTINQKQLLTDMCANSGTFAQSPYGYILIAVHNKWFILYRLYGDEGGDNYTLVHKNDLKFFEAYFKEYEDAIRQADIIDGQIQEIKDIPITQAEVDESTIRWNDYETSEAEQLLQLKPGFIQSYEAQIQDTQDQNASDIDAAKQQYADFVQQTLELTAKDNSDAKTILLIKAALIGQKAQNDLENKKEEIIATIQGNAKEGITTYTTASSSVADSNLGSTINKITGSISTNGVAPSKPGLLGGGIALVGLLSLGVIAKKKE